MIPESFSMCPQAKEAKGQVPVAGMGCADDDEFFVFLEV